MMKLSMLRLFGVLAVLASTGTAHGETPPPDNSAQVAARTSVSIPQTTQFDFTSKVNGRSYRVQVATPLLPPPPGGYPVVYVLDASQFFGTVTEASRFRSLGGDLKSSVIVGITYPDPSTLISNGIRRSLDLTPTADPAASQMLKSAYGVAPETGGAEQFHQIIETEIKPRVAQHVSVDPAKSILFGHSYGGLFALYVLFNHPDTYNTYLALSPSIWWDHRAVLKGEGAFAKRVAARNIAPRLFIGVGAGEQARKTVANPSGSASAPADDYLMVDNAVDLADRLRPLGATPGFELKSQVYEGRSHVGVYWAAIDDLLDFALSSKR